MIRRFCLAMMLLAIHLGSVLTAQEPRVIRHDELVRHLAFLPGDKQVLGACSQFAAVWDIESGREVRRFPKLSSIMCAATSPDGKTVAVAENGQRVFLYDIASGEELRHVTGDKSERAIAIAWSPDSRLLAACFARVTIVWDMTTGKRLHRLIGDGDYLFVVAFAPSGKMLASGGHKTIQLWDLTTEKVSATLTGAFGGASSGALLFASDGKSLVGQCDEAIGKGVTRSSLRQWDVTTGNKVRDLAPGSFHRVAFSSGSTVLASGAGNKIRLWDPTTGKEIRSWVVGVEQVTSLAFSRDGKILAYGGHKGHVRFCDATTGKAGAAGADEKEPKKKPSQQNDRK